MNVFLSVAALVGLAVVIGTAYRLKGIESWGIVPSRIELEKLIGVEASSSGANVLLFTTEFCSKCPQVRKNLQKNEVRFAEIDVTDRLDLASKLQIKQTPTLIVVEPNGQVRSRLSGPISQKQITDLGIKEVSLAKN